MADRAHRAQTPRPRRRPPSRATIVWRRLVAVAGLIAVATGVGLGAAAVLGATGASTTVATISLRAPAGTPTVRIGGAQRSDPIAPGFLGFSFEYTALLPYAGRDGRDRVLIQLIRNLNPGQSPVLRIGGDTTDWSWVPVRGMSRPGGVRYTITPAWLGAIRGLTQALNARVILGINLEADSTRLAATEARAFVSAVGPSAVAALEIGNEPELYGQLGWYSTPSGRPVPGRPSSYDIASYTAEFRRFATALPDVPLAGPATGSNTWLAGLPGFIAGAPRLRFATAHRYPLARCYSAAGSPTYPTLANLLSPAASSGLAQSVAGAVSVAHAHGVRFRVDELNSVSCRGKRGLSDTFASALWALDTLFAMASVNVDGVNIHTLPASDYHPFALVRSGRAWHWTVDPLYYGLLMFARAAPPGSRLLSTSGPAQPSVRVWATGAPDGRTRVVVINEHRRRTAYERIEVPGAHSPAALTTLRAPSITAKGGITLGGQTFGARTATGLPTGARRLVDVAPAGDAYVLKLAPASAAMLTLHG